MTVEDDRCCEADDPDTTSSNLDKACSDDLVTPDESIALAAIDEPCQTLIENTGEYNPDCEAGLECTDVSGVAGMMVCT